MNQGLIAGAAAGGPFSRQGPTMFKRSIYMPFDYTFQPSDVGAFIGQWNTGISAGTPGEPATVTYTIPNSNQCNIPLYSMIYVAFALYRLSSFTITLAPAAGVTLRAVGTSSTANATLTQETSLITLLKMDENEWWWGGGGGK